MVEYVLIKRKETMNRKILTEVILRALSEYDWTSGKGADSGAMAESIAGKIINNTYDLYTPSPEPEDNFDVTRDPIPSVCLNSSSVPAYKVFTDGPSELYTPRVRSSGSVIDKNFAEATSLWKREGLLP